METILAIVVLAVLLGIVAFGIGVARYIFSGRYEMDQRVDSVTRW